MLVDGMGYVQRTECPTYQKSYSPRVLVQTRGTRACVSNTVRYCQAPRIAFQISGAVPP